MKQLMENWRRYLAESQIGFSGILKISPSPRVLDDLRVPLANLPEGAVRLPDEKLHVTLIHQQVLKPYRDQIKEAGDNPPWANIPVPEVQISTDIRNPSDGEKTSWAIMVENQKELKDYVIEVMRSLGAEPTDPEPDRQFHITLANKTGRVGDSVSLREKGAKNGRDWQKESDRITDHPRLKKQVLDLGPNKEAGGGKGHKKASYKRGKSAPAMEEAIELDIEVGDILLGGKYRNKRVEVKEIGTDELGQPTINGKSILKFRIEKHLPDEKKSKKTLESEASE